MNKNIKVIIFKRENGCIKKEYIKKKEFLEINDSELLYKYIKFIKKIKSVNIEILLNNLNNIIYEMSTYNMDMSNIKLLVNNYYKNIKKYKNHILLLKKYKNYANIITKYYANIFDKYNIIDTIRYIFHLLYNEKILSKKDIIEWYDNLNKESIYLSSNVLKDFIEWIEDQSSSEYDDNKDNNDNNDTD